MAMSAVAAATLEARPHHLFSTDYEVSANGTRLTTLDLALLRSRGTFLLDGEEYRVQTRGFTFGTVTLEHRDRELARADRESVLPLRYGVRLHDRTLTLGSYPPSRRFTLRHGDREVATIRPRRLFSRVALFEGGDEIPPAIRIFLLAVALLRWRRRARGSSSGG